MEPQSFSSVLLPRAGLHACVCINCFSNKILYSKQGLSLWVFAFETLGSMCIVPKWHPIGRACQVGLPGDRSCGLKGSLVDCNDLSRECSSRVGFTTNCWYYGTFTMGQELFWAFGQLLTRSTRITILTILPFYRGDSNTDISQTRPQFSAR